MKWTVAVQKGKPRLNYIEFTRLSTLWDWTARLLLSSLYAKLELDLDLCVTVLNSTFSVPRIDSWEILWLGKNYAGLWEICIQNVFHCILSSGFRIPPHSHFSDFSLPVPSPPQKEVYFSGICLFSLIFRISWTVGWISEGWTTLRHHLPHFVC